MKGKAKDEFDREAELVFIEITRTLHVRNEELCWSWHRLLVRALLLR